MNSEPSARFPQRPSSEAVFSKGVGTKAPLPTATVLVVTTLCLFLCLFFGTQGVAVRDHVDLRGYVDCSNPCPRKYIGYGIGLFVLEIVW